jgi:hypothetical protein
MSVGKYDVSVQVYTLYVLLHQEGDVDNEDSKAGWGFWKHMEYLYLLNFAVNLKLLQEDCLFKKVFNKIYRKPFKCYQLFPSKQGPFSLSEMWN